MDLIIDCWTKGTSRVQKQPVCLIFAVVDWLDFPAKQA